MQQVTRTSRRLHRNSVQVLGSSWLDMTGHVSEGGKVGTRVVSQRGVARRGNV